MIELERRIYYWLRDHYGRKFSAVAVLAHVINSYDPPGTMFPHVKNALQTLAEKYANIHSEIINGQEFGFIAKNKRSGTGGDMDFVEPVLKRLDRIFNAWSRWRYWNEEAVLLKRTQLEDDWYDGDGNVEFRTEFCIDKRVVAKKDKDVIEALEHEGYTVIHEAKRKALMPDDYIKEKAKIMQ